MAEVGVHVDDDRGAPVEGHAEPIEIRPTQALLRLAVANADARIGGRELIGDLAGAVGRAVVDDEKRRRGQHVEHGGRDRSDVLGLVVGRDDDPDGRREGAHGRAV